VLVQIPDANTHESSRCGIIIDGFSPNIGCPISFYGDEECQNALMLVGCWQLGD
jgi:hypothetical protein